MNTLLLRHVAIDTYKENVAYLHRDCKLYRSEGFQALNKIEITNQESGQSIIALLNIVDDDCITAPDELGLSEQAFAQLGARERDYPGPGVHLLVWLHQPSHHPAVAG